MAGRPWAAIGRVTVAFSASFRLISSSCIPLPEHSADAKGEAGAPENP